MHTTPTKPIRSRHHLTASLVGIVVVMALAVAACGSDSSASGSGDSGSSGKTETVRFALDWTPNTDHTGLYVADKLGYFGDKGINLKILPFNNTQPDTLVGAGKAECGISFADGFTFAMANGTPNTAVMAVLQKPAWVIGVKAARDDITSPKDLDGKTYAGFGTPSDEPTMKKIIQNDGGKGEFKTVTLGTSAYEAVYSGKADFTAPFVAWEVIEAKLTGQPFKTFSPLDYGFPTSYGVIVMCNNDWLKNNKALATNFIQALQKGYEYGVTDPKAAAKILIDANKGSFSSEDLVYQSQDKLAKDMMLDAKGKFGYMTLDNWTKYSGFLYDSGVLVDANGKKLTSPPDYKSFFTNAYLAPQS